MQVYQMIDSLCAGGNFKGGSVKYDLLYYAKIFVSHYRYLIKIESTIGG